MPETTQPISYETLIRAQITSDRLKELARSLEELAGRLDVWINEHLGLVEGGRLKGGCYSEAIADEFFRCVDARAEAQDE